MHTVKYGMQTVLNHIKPLTAYDYLEKLVIKTINHNKKPLELRYGDKICLVKYDNLISDVINKGLLPKKNGGLESPNVVVITSNSKFDFYDCISITKKKYGMNIYKVLDHVLVSRVFTIYQLAQKIIYELPELLEKFKSKLLVIISDLFLSKSHQQIYDKEEKDWLINKQIIKAIKGITNSIVLIFSSIALPNFTNYTK